MIKFEIQFPFQVVWSKQNFLKWGLFKGTMKNDLSAALHMV